MLTRQKLVGRGRHSFLLARAVRGRRRTRRWRSRFTPTTRRRVPLAVCSTAKGTNVANSGQGYGKKVDCKKMVENFKDDISKYTFEVYEDNKKQQRFRLKAKNSNVVGSHRPASYQDEGRSREGRSRRSRRGHEGRDR